MAASPLRSIQPFSFLCEIEALLIPLSLPFSLSISFSLSSHSLPLVYLGREVKVRKKYGSG